MHAKEKQKMQNLKIIDCHNGLLRLEPECLQKILDKSSQYNDVPVAFLAIIGPPQSGKSFLTNLLLKCLEKSGEGGWMEQLFRDGEFKQGFHFDSVNTSQSLFVPSSEISGIYLWPTPYLMTKDEGDEVLIWILHYHVPDTSSFFSEDINAIEKFLALACSRMVEIFAGNEKFHLGRIKRAIASSSINSSEYVCNSLVLFDLTDKPLKPGSKRVFREDEAKDTILEMNMTAGRGHRLNKSMLDEFSFLNLVRMKKSSDALHDQNGKLLKTMTNLAPKFKDLMSTIMEEDEVLAKRGRDGQPITVSKVMDYLNSCVDQANQSKMANETPLVVRKQAGTRILEKVESIRRSPSSSSSSSSSLSSARSDSNSTKFNLNFQTTPQAYNRPIPSERELGAKLRSSSSSLESFRNDSDIEVKTPIDDQFQPSFHVIGTAPIPLPRRLSQGEVATKAQSPTKTISFHGTDTSSEDSDSNPNVENSNASVGKPLTSEKESKPNSSILATFDLFGSNNSNNTDPYASNNYPFPNVVKTPQPIPRKESSSYYSSSSESSSYDSEIDEALNNTRTTITQPVVIPEENIFPIKQEATRRQSLNPFESEATGFTLNLDTEHSFRKEERVIFSEQYHWADTIAPGHVSANQLVFAASDPLQSPVEASYDSTSPTEHVPITDQRARQDQDLGSLVLRLTYNQITMGVSIGGEFKMIQNPKGELSTPVIVGVNNYGKLVYGTDAMTQCSSRNPPLSHWWITEFFANDRFNSCRYLVTLNVGGREVSHEISVEFLLGYLLRSLKEYAETLLNGCFSQVIITVPFWFCSTHRIQVKDAAIVAGFPDVKLINEESAVAYARAFGKRLTGVIVPTGNVLVLSENFGIITAILYSYSNQNHKKTTMMAYAFSNDWMEIKKKMDLKPEANVNKAQLLRIKAKTNLVKKVCTTLFKKKFNFNKKDPMDVVLLTGSDLKDIEEVEWLQTFEKVSKDKGFEIVSDEEGSCLTVLLGASLVTQMSQRECMQEHLALDVLNYSHENHKPEKIFAKKENPFIPSKTNQDAVILSKVREVKIFQKNILSEREILVGEIIVGPSISPTRNVYPIFEINSEAIISLTEVKSDPGRFRPTGAVENITDYVWSVPSIGNDRKIEISRFIDIIMQDEENRRFVSEA